jgi:protein-tyrosine phosphatase
MGGVIIPRLSPGEAGDAPAVVRLRDAAARWQRARGISQWTPGERTAGWFADRARRGELFVVRDGPQVIAAVLLQRDDEIAWGARLPEAGYLHNLVIDRRQAGQGLGRAVIAAAEARIAAWGRHTARLDCLESNGPLRAYYRRAGYREVGRKSFEPSPWHPVTLFEKHLGNPLGTSWGAFRKCDVPGHGTGAARPPTRVNRLSVTFAVTFAVNMP